MKNIVDKRIRFALTLFTGIFLPMLALGAPSSLNDTRLLSHFEALTKLGKLPAGGTSRLAYSDADKQARTLVVDWMKEAGLDVEIDPAGNIVGVKSGKGRGLKPIVTGSHIDTVPEGGNFDGVVGSLAAIEIAHSLKDAKKDLQHSLEIIVFQNEEGGHFGSRAITSGLSKADLGAKSLSGKIVAEGIDFIGGNIQRLEKFRRSQNSVAAFLELHIEQGEMLERKHRQIGIVEGIVGISRWQVTVEGAANHAGTTPMKYRRDALVAASKFITDVFETTRKLAGQQVATVGKLEVKPGAPNVVPGKVELTLEIRDLSQDKIDMLFKEIEGHARKIGKITKTTFAFQSIYQTKPVLTDKKIQNVARSSAKNLSLTTLDLPSGAGHDAQEFRDLGPIGMLFIPSKGGLSHSPLEYSSPEAIVLGARVLLSTVEALDRSL